MKYKKRGIKTALLLVVILTICNACDGASKNEKKIGDVYPQLSLTPLGSAIMTGMPKGVLLRSGEITVTPEDIETHFAAMPAEIQDELKDNKLFLMEQIFTEKIVLDKATASLTAEGKDAGEMTEREIYGEFFAGLTAHIAVSDEEIADFYDDNKDLMGGMPFEMVEQQIGDFIRQQQQQEIVEDYVRNLITDKEIKVSERWVKEKAATALNNPVDKARVAGKPAVIIFCSESSETCSEIEPIRQAVAEKFKNRVVIVSMDADENQFLASRYGIQTVPTFIFYDKKGYEADRLVDGVVDNQIIEYLELLLD